MWNPAIDLNAGRDRENLFGAKPLLYNADHQGELTAMILFKKIRITTDPATKDWTADILIFVSGILTLLFGTLSAFNVISWSWPWILAPIWIPASIFLVVAAYAYVVVIVKGK
jgi:hypothetical protein